MNLHPSTEIVFVMSTVESIAQADILAREILESKIAACVTSLPGAISSYWWEDKIERSQEIILIIKTIQTNLGRIEEIFSSYHSYELPEFVVLPAAGGSTKYLDWIRKNSIGD